ncbi:MAG: ABC transporter substrate-binding protein, partial [Ilumatobacteraceae bacterium]
KKREGEGKRKRGGREKKKEKRRGKGRGAAEETAGERINQSGGVLEQPVILRVADEGSTSATAAEAIEELLDAGVDAIVGPSSSTVAIDNLSQILGAGVLACSPTASALALDDYPDDDLLFFRTIPSDSLQAQAIAVEVEATGAQTAVIASVDDSFGQLFTEAVEEALADRGIETAESVTFRGTDDDLADAAAEIVESGASPLVLLADDDHGSSLLEALGNEAFGGVEEIIVNDALSNPASAPRIGALNPLLRTRIKGVAPQSMATDTQEEVEFGPFAFNAFDCVNLIALATEQGKSDAPRSIRTQMQSVSVGGRLCRSFESCTARMSEGRQINYDGPSGITDLRQRGDPARARFVLFEFDNTGRSVLLDPTRVVPI